MKVSLFVHSLVSCWNHGNAHFLRGVVRELQRRGHDVAVYEPRSSWSRANLVADHGSAWLAHGHDVAPSRPDPLGQQPKLRALAGAFGALEHDEQAGRHAGVSRG